MPKAQIGSAARDDLRDIRIYSKAAFGTVAARAYLLGLRGVFTFVGENPSAGVAENDLGNGMRSYGYRSHRVYYRADAAGILIVRILHHARDVPRVMGGGA
ncbi:type II toxin-antitoxin system RelE/ParE family toxin [Sphingomonas sp. GB1N7]|uniref:type II toxin-antitoxin system RelE/ParE family toxin n=1 Tax=Parasphingomonas caseinilytica TaxID=3096158 RepID=UPI002FC773C0